MSDQFLGGTIDVHGGGADLLFPHHECEIAQAQAADDDSPFVRVWMHTAMVRHEGEKMSKSLGNLVMVRDLLQSWSPDGLRLYMSGHHYRVPWSHSETELAEAEQLAGRLREAAAAVSGAGGATDPAPMVAQFGEAMDSDLDTPSAVRAIGGLAEQILDGSSGRRNVAASQQALRAMGSVLGLRLDRGRTEDRVSAGWAKHLSGFT
jgi:L-cysteine:1D-myo-inositol 2-amino-2-deoxy-alpha-D-glucopyranoside ligase